ncbi:MAG TPA: hypothetical protein VN673_12390 [Clostridia bacterium]|nr:hypothetical protein [Clostridia bacterium]
MDYESQLKLQAYLDGELSEDQASEVANWLARDKEAVALLTELRQSRQAFGRFQSTLRLPESGDFFWSKIRREIELSEPESAPAVPQISLFQKLRRFLVPAGALAVLTIAGIIVTRDAGVAISTGEGEVGEMALADSGAFTYRDYSAGTTLVWLSYPAEKEIADEDASTTLD